MLFYSAVEKMHTVAVIMPTFLTERSFGSLQTSPRSRLVSAGVRSANYPDRVETPGLHPSTPAEWCQPLLLLGDAVLVLIYYSGWGIRLGQGRVVSDFHLAFPPLVGLTP